MPATLRDLIRQPAPVAILALSLAAGCQNDIPDHTAAPLDSGDLDVLFDFEHSDVGGDVVLNAATAELVTRGATSGSQALNVQLQSKDHKHSGIVFRPATPWDWSEFRDFSLAFDFANHGEVSVQLWLNISDVDGQTMTMAVSVPVGDAHTYYAKLQGHDLASPPSVSGVELNFASGLRSNPATWESDDTIFVSLWGTKNLKLSGITQIALATDTNIRDKEFTVDNVRLIPNPPMNESFLDGIVDRFGQNAKQDFRGKIHSEQDMLAQRDAELEALNGGEALPDRSRFGGWKDGPQLEGTGFFRAAKVGAKWSLIDPEGYLYFATGIDIIRLSNSTTMTGYDFDQERIVQRAATDTTPEDSEGLNRVSTEAIPSRHLVSALRANMFEWLPDYDDALGNHYGYRRSAHSGPLPRGETYSFYSANLERKYGEDTPGAHLDAWEEVTIDRMRNWGFTSLGNWTDPRFYDQQRLPFFANGWIIGDFKTVSSGDDFWAPLPDVFDPVFTERAMVTAQQVASEVQGTPWCVGVFIDNEKSFGRSGSNEGRYGLVIHTLKRNGEEVPSKRAFTELMRDKYKSIDALNEAWELDLTGWDAFDAGVDSDIRNDVQLADYSAMLYHYANRYFSVVHDALQAVMPNHMYLGSRFADWGMPPEVLAAATEHVDVVSYNVYKEGLAEHAWTFLEDIDMPAIVGEFHFGASDSGLFHPGLLHASSQEDRARMYTEYMHSVIDNPYFIGAHWFQYVDSPITGRALDGENYNVGFVSVADVPYEPMIEAAKRLHGDMYRRRFGE